MALPRLIVMLGIIACDKSELGAGLTKRFGEEIVSVDPRQVHWGLGLGTGEMTEEEMEGVPHHMLDVVKPNQPHSVAGFQTGTYAATDGTLSRGSTSFLMGGTELYVRVVTEGFASADARSNPALRTKLEGETTAELYVLLREKTGVILTDGEEFNRQRLMRSVEKVLFGQWEGPPSHPRYDCLLLGVTFSRDVVCRRIDERLQARLNAGMVEKVAALRVGGTDDSFLEGLGLEYYYILWYLTGKISTPGALKDELGRAIKHSAKRQMAQFQEDRDMLWLDMEGDFLARAIRAVEDSLV